MRLPSAFVITTGSPPSIMATQEFVVPRSIPITLAIENSPYCPGELTTGLVLGKVFRARRRPGDRDESRAKEALVEAVARLVLLDDGIRGVLGALDLGHGLVVRRIKRLALRGHAGEPVPLEHVEEGLQHHRD